MVRERLKNIEIVYNRRYLKEKNIIKKNIEKINIILYELWRLGSCEEIKLYILNSNIKFLICIYPFLQKLIFFLLFPIVYFKNRDVFKRSGCIYIDSNTSRILIKSCKYLSS